mgnify:CR=1 FL=1
MEGCTMTKPSLIFRYYKGESENPFDGIDQNKAMLWRYEKTWSIHADKGDGFNESFLDEYTRIGLRDFMDGDGIPRSLKAMLFNRYATECRSMMSAVEPFKEFYLRYYKDGGQ